MGLLGFGGSAIGFIKQQTSLIKCPKAFKPNAKRMIHEMYLSPTKEATLKAYDSFLKLYTTKYPRSCKYLERNKEQLFTFYDYPADHLSPYKHNESN